MSVVAEKQNSHGSDANMARVMGQLEQDEVVARRLQVRLIMSRGLQTVLNIWAQFLTMLNRL